MDYEFNYLNDLFFGLYVAHFPSLVVLHWPSFVSFPYPPQLIHRQHLKMIYRPSTQTSSQGESSTMTTTTNGDLNSSQFVNSLLVEEEPKPNGGIFYPFPQQPKMDLSCSQEGLGSNGQLGSDKDDEEPEIIEDDDTKDVEEEEEDGLSSSPPTIYLDGSCGQQSNQDLPTQMASLEVTTSGGPRKKRKHEDEVPFSLHTEQDPQRLVSDQAVPNDLFATEIPVSSATFAFAASNSSIPPVTKTEPLTSFVPPSSSQSSSSASSSTSQSFPPRLSAVHSTAQQQLNQVHAMQIQQKGTTITSHHVPIGELPLTNFLSSICRAIAQAS